MVYRRLVLVDPGRLYALPRNLVLAASAGTGKTHALVGVVVDAGYTAEQDYLFAKEAEAWADILIASSSATTDHSGEGRKQKYFGRAARYGPHG